MRKRFWDNERIKEGFELFKNKHGRLPTALEVDELGYLPSARYIQKKFGGLEKLRATLGYADTHFGKGKFRSLIAHRVNHRGRSAEHRLESALAAHFGEVFVHTEKMFGKSKNRVDFYVYSPEGNFGVDIFESDHVKNLQSTVNIKMPKYREFSKPLYFVEANATISQKNLDAFALAKRHPLPENVRLVTLSELMCIIGQMAAYPNPIN